MWFLLQCIFINIISKQLKKRRMSHWPKPVLLLRRGLVDPPAISSFEWIQNETVASSLPFVTSAVASYLSLTLLLHHGRLLVPLPSAFSLRLLSCLHNLLLLVLSAAMAAGCSLAALSQMPSLSWLLCFPPSTPPRGPVFFWAHVFYLSKIYEFLDTALILLSGDRGRRRLSFLHVYHHAVVVVMSYLWLATRQSLLPVALVTNATVHVAMYGYYLSASLGWRWSRRWKRAVTRLQIAQFVFSFVASVCFLWLHVAGKGCEGMKGWVFNAVFNASLLALFLDFHSASYDVGDGGLRKEKREL
ncbi:hypothetical protein HPP92_003666 [Vanilla planifolia]|uniref:very-long-chain 3-oxoacyl-CoA synthase n=1 Tax=Vanilla planifolia TaxID=51239 RepID=A0A835S8I2_VANPL|nr:hypothetical protein HPP92_004119 [Vanilla planifolia]KAG0503594.1 hypothetical protein HPP92_003666 [Vanilla planifolia]